jgi:hypothetical protein
MMEPSSNAVELIVKPGTAGAAAGGACAFARDVTVLEIARIAQIVSIRFNLILLLSPFEFSNS